MKLKRALLLVGLFLSATVFAIFAQDKPKEEPKVPVISVEFKAKFFKAQAQAEKAQNELQQTPQWKESQAKQQAFQAVIQEFQGMCGKEYVPYLDPAGDPGCQLKPKEPKK